MNTFKDKVASIRPFLSEDLCSEANFELILKAADQFPSLWLGMLEVRLVDDPAAAGVDFGVLLFREHQHFEEILNHYSGKGELSPEWKKRLKFIEACQSGNAFAASVVDRVWVAFDIDKDQGDRSWDYIGFDQRYNLPFFMVGALKQIFQSYGFSGTPENMERLANLLAKLPEGVHLDSVGLPSLRNQGQMHLCLFPLTQFQQLDSILTIYLGENFLPFSAAIFEACVQASEWCLLRLDLEQAGEKKVGIEFGFSEKKDEVQFPALFEVLEGEEWFEGKHLDTIKQWSFRSSGGEGENVNRYIDHLKLTITEKGRTTAKVYLGFF